jgi:hypothetical protein
VSRRPTDGTAPGTRRRNAHTAFGRSRSGRRPPPQRAVTRRPRE